MVSERELASNFLLDRTDFSKAISNDKFKRLFPKGTSNETINQIRIHLNRKSAERYDQVADDIERYFDEVEEKKEIQARKLKESQDSSSIELVNSKLDSLSKLLDAELDFLKEGFQQDLQKLDDINEDFSDIPYPSKRDDNFTDEHIKEIVESLNRFESKLSSHTSKEEEGVS